MMSDAPDLDLIRTLLGSNRHRVTDHHARKMLNHIEALERKLEERDQLLDWISDQIAFAVQGDCENGVKWLNERAAASYLKDAPKLAKAISDIQDKILEIDDE